MARIPLTPELLVTYQLFDKAGLIGIFSEINKTYMQGSTDIVDLGCGHAEAYKAIQDVLGNPYITGYDSDPEALATARANNPSDKVFFEEHLLPDRNISRTFNGIISMFFLHQLDDPTVVWNSVKQLSGTGTRICVIDLVRIEDLDTIEGIVSNFTKPGTIERDAATAAFQAAYSIEEVVQQLYAAGLIDLSIESILAKEGKFLVVHGTM